MNIGKSEIVDGVVAVNGVMVVDGMMVFDGMMAVRDSSMTLPRALLKDLASRQPENCTKVSD